MKAKRENGFQGEQTRMNHSRWLPICSTILIVVLSFGQSMAEPNPENYMQGQLVPDPDNPRWLVTYDRKGNHEPFMVVGPADPEAFFYLRDEKHPEKLIQRLIDHGGNSIYVILDRTGDGPSHEQPYKGGEADNGIDEKILHEWYTWLKKADDAGIVTFFFFYDDDVNPWGRSSTVSPEERRLMKSVVDKLSPIKHLVWYFAEEYEEAFNSDRAQAWAKTLRELDPHDHVIGISTRGPEEFGEEDNPYVEQWGLQCNLCSDEDWHECAVNAWKILREDQHLNMLENTCVARGSQVRRRLWASAIGGAAVSMDWSNKIYNATVQELKDMKTIKDFFESSAVNITAPLDRLAYKSTKWVLAKPGENYIGYGVPGAAEMGFREMEGGTYRIRWLDCVTGESVYQTVQARGGSNSWSVPDHFSDEVALHAALMEDLILD